MAKQNKNRLMQIRVSAATISAWKEAASGAGMSLSAWIRARCDGSVVIEAPAPRRKAA